MYLHSTDVYNSIGLLAGRVAELDAGLHRIQYWLFILLVNEVKRIYFSSSVSTVCIF